MSVSKLPDLPRPTNKDLQKQIREVHDCLHNVDAKVDDAKKEAVKAAVAAEEAARKAAYVEGVVLGVARTLGSPIPTADGQSVKAHPRFGGLRTWQAVFVMFSGVSGALLALKAVEAVLGPWLSHINHVLLTLH